MGRGADDDVGAISDGNGPLLLFLGAIAVDGHGFSGVDSAAI